MLHDLSVVIVTRNEGALLRGTIENIRATLPERSEIVVVDDGSTDGSTDFLAGRNGQIRLLRGDGLGVAKARNWGARESRGAMIVFSDAHVKVGEGWWRPLAELLENERVGWAGPAIGDLSHPERKGYGYHFLGPDLDMDWMPQRQEDPYEVPQLGGCFVSMRRDVFEVTGGFDPWMIGWGLNDSEFCMRLWALGYELQVAPRSEVWHLFREEFPYSVDGTLVVHNALRLALIHFEGERLARVVDHYRHNPAFPAALALALEREVCARREEIARQRVHDREWVFRRFGMEW